MFFYIFSIPKAVFKLVFYLFETMTHTRIGINLRHFSAVRQSTGGGVFLVLAPFEEASSMSRVSLW